MSQEKDKVPAKERQELTIPQIKAAITTEQAKTKHQSEQTTWFGHPAWVFVFSGLDLECWRLYKLSDDPKKQQFATAKLVQLCLCDKNGKRFYSDIEIPHIAGLKPGKEMDHIRDIAMRINGYSNEGLDEILKNLQTILGDSGLQELHANITAQLKSSSQDTPPTRSPSNT
jgi:hypothetical protein